jgi:hypothetical protein
MNNPDHISVSLKTIFWVKILKSFDKDPGSGIGNSRIRDSGQTFLIPNADKSTKVLSLLAKIFWIFAVV